MSIAAERLRTHLRAQRVAMCRLALLLCLDSPALRGQSAQSGSNSRSQDLAQLSIEDLMEIKVTSATKKEEKISRTAAAIFVITQEDIRRSGMTSVADLLRMVPGMEVAQIDASNWPISARGLNGRFADKLLVLVDGRSLYSPDFAGIFWQTLDLPLEDIERIEVIRGPGATLWGANAVNGVINIIMKKTTDTQGALLTVGGGMQERGFSTARYGGTRGDRFAYRVYGDYCNRGDFEDAAGRGAGDAWEGIRAGFRTDSQLSTRDVLMVEGDFYRNPSQVQTLLASFAPPATTTPLTSTTFLGGDVNGRWTHTYSPKSEMSLGMYYDKLRRENVLINAKIFNCVGYRDCYHLRPSKSICAINVEVRAVMHGCQRYHDDILVFASRRNTALLFVRLGLRIILFLI